MPRRIDLQRCSTRRRRAQAVGAFVALFALLLQASVPLWHRPALPPGTSGNRAIHVALGHLLAATPRSDDRGSRRDDGGRGPQDSVPSCPVCQALQHFGAFVAPEIHVIVPLLARSTLRPAPAIRARSLFAPRFAWARGPPFRA